MEQTLNTSNNTHTTNDSQWNLPEPNFEVCGADTDYLDFWNQICIAFQAYPTAEDFEGERIIDRYLENRVINRRLLSSPSKFLSSEVCQEIPKCDICPLKYNCSYFSDKRQPSQEITFADFFCGAGGLSLGFEMAGLYPVLANDIDPWFIATYKFNRPNYRTEVSACDIHSWLIENNNRYDWNIDIVSGGVPCQSFSNANRQKKESDPRDKLYLSLLRAAELIKPKVILIENVSGMIKEYDGVQNDLERLGYDSDHIIINSKDYGIPQSRRRLFFVAFSKEHFIDSEYRVKKTVQCIQESTYSRYVTLKDAINDLPPLVAHSIRNDTKFNNALSGKSFIYHSISAASDYVKTINKGKELTALFNHKARYNNLRDVEIFGTLKPGENSLAQSIRHIMPYSDRNHVFKDKYFKLRFDTYCKTITAHMRYDCNMYIHPEQARGLTAREAARIQSFPDDYVFLGNFQRLYQQVGNAVPPLLARVLAKAIKNNLN